MKQYMLLSSFLRRQTTTKSKWHFLDSCFARVFSLISSKWAKQDLCSLLIFRIKHLHCGAPSLQNDPFHVPVKHFSDPAEACRIISTVAVVYSMYCIKEKKEALLILRSYSMFRYWLCHSLPSCQNSFKGLIKNHHIKYNSSRYLSGETAPCLLQRLMLALKLFLHWDVFLLANGIQQASVVDFMAPSVYIVSRHWGVPPHN